MIMNIPHKKIILILQNIDLQYLNRFNIFNTDYEFQ